MLNLVHVPTHPTVPNLTPSERIAVTEFSRQYQQQQAQQEQAQQQATLQKSQQRRQNGKDAVLMLNAQQQQQRVISAYTQEQRDTASGVQLVRDASRAANRHQLTAYYWAQQHNEKPQLFSISV